MSCRECAEGPWTLWMWGTQQDLWPPPERPTSPCWWVGCPGLEPAPRQQQVSRGSVSGTSQLWPSGAWVHITCNPGIRPCFCLRYREVGKRGPGPFLWAEACGLSGRFTLTPSSRITRGRRTMHHPKKASLIHTRNHGIRLLPARYTRRTNVERVVVRLTCLYKAPDGS